jgi:hypothetical protein
LNAGRFDCTVSIATEGDYRIWAHVYAPGPSQDSWFVTVDAADDLSFTPTPTPGPDLNAGPIFDTSEQQQPCTGGSPSCSADRIGWLTTWFWAIENKRDGTCGSCTGVGAEYRPHLTVGTHTLSFRGREVPAGESAYIDYFVMTTDLNYNPAVITVPTPTPGPNQCKRAFLCKNRVVWELQPCNRQPVPPCSR